MASELLAAARKNLAAGRAEEACSLALAAIKEEPNFPLAWFTAGQARSTQGRTSDAALAFLRCVQLTSTGEPKFKDVRSS